MFQKEEGHTVIILHSSHAIHSIPFILVTFLFVSRLVHPLGQQKIILPSYFHPTQQDWSDILENIESKPKIEYVILNPHNGPGQSCDDDYLFLRQGLHKRRIKVLGYVHTGYVKRNMELVKQDVLNFVKWYKVDGIFVDEVSNDNRQSTMAYYNTLSDFIRSQSRLLISLPNPAAGNGHKKPSVHSHRRSKEMNVLRQVAEEPSTELDELTPNSSSERSDTPLAIVLNFGTTTHEGFVPLGDILVTFEGNGASYLTSHETKILESTSMWERKYGKNKFCHLIYDIENDVQFQLIKSISERHAHYVFFTDLTLHNPWLGLPSFWDHMNG